MPEKLRDRSWVRVGQQLAGWCVVVCLLAGAGCAAGHARLDRLAWEQSHLIDLTHSFGEDTIVWPTEQDFRLVLQQAGETPGGYYYASNRLEMAEHGGTHIDAPFILPRVGKRWIRSRSNVWLGPAFELTWPPNAPAIGITSSLSRISSNGKKSTGESRLVRLC